MINAPISKVDLTAVALKAQRMLVTPEDLADGELFAKRSAMIFNSTLEARPRNTSPELAPAIVLEPNASAPKKRMLTPDATQSPSKRLRGRPARAVVEQPIRPLSPTIPSSGRLKRPTKKPTRNGGKTVKARTAEEVYEFPEDSPLKQTKSLPATHENNNDPQESHEGTAFDHSRSVVVRLTTDPKEANIKASVLPRKRGRPPKGSTKPSSHNGENNPPALTHIPIPQSGSSLQDLERPEKSTSSMGKGNGLTKRPVNSFKGKSEPIRKEVSITSRSVSIESVVRRVSVEPETASAQASKVSSELNGHLGEEVGYPRTGEQENLTRNDDQDFVGEQSEETRDNLEEQSDPMELQDDVYNVSDEGERSTDQNHSSVAAVLEIDAGRAAVALEIFGTEERWKRVLQAARSVGLKKGKSVSSERRVDHKIPLLSNTIKSFVEKVKEACLCYQKANAVENTNTANQHNLHSHLRDHTNGLEWAVENIHESKNAHRNVECIQDIYVHAVPQMVFLLKNALNAQPKLYSADQEKESLKHILGVQDLVIELCKKVGSLSESAKKKGQELPITNLPIKGATSRKILPYLRDIRDAIEMDLVSIREKWRRTEEESARLKMYEAREARWQERCEKNRLEREQKQRQATEDVLRLLGRPLVTKANGQHRRNTLELDQWTADQDYELLRLLWDLGDLPGMYLSFACSYIYLYLQLQKLNGAMLLSSILLSSRISCRNISGSELLR